MSHPNSISRDPYVGNQQGDLPLPKSVSKIDQIVMATLGIVSLALIAGAVGLLWKNLYPIESLMMVTFGIGGSILSLIKTKDWDDKNEVKFSGKGDDQGLVQTQIHSVDSNFIQPVDPATTSPPVTNAPSNLAPLQKEFIEKTSRGVIREDRFFGAEEWKDSYSDRCPYFF